jgi:hypothetical protein
VGARRQILLAFALAGAALVGVPQAHSQTSDPPPDPPLPPELVAAPPTSLHATMDYGARAGMEVSILGMGGRDAAHAVIRFKHTRDNAIAFCRDFVRNVTEDCVQENLAAESGFKEAITGNCDSGEFSDFQGGRYRFLGRNPKSGYFSDNKYIIKDLATGEIADGSEISRYSINMNVYRALCPARAPVDLDATIVGMEGRDTARAVVRLKHTREDAGHACQEYGTVRNVTEDCIREELARRTKDVIIADCLAGEFTDFYGNRYRVSVNTDPTYPAAKANITNLVTSALVDQFASDFKLRQPMPAYRALCPAHAPT